MKAAVAVVVVLILVAIQWFRPIAKPALEVSSDQMVRSAAGSTTMPWPSQGQATFAALGVGSFGSSGPDQSVPIASVTKLMTAYLVLEKHPLKPGENGPTLTMTAQDASIWRKDLQGQQSVVKVAPGEKLTERQLLEALLIPSGNNIATVLAKWVGGSVPSFVSMMNAKAKALGMTHTHYVDASGLNPQSVSSAKDLMKLATRLMQIDAFRSIVRMPQAILPVAGKVYNVDYVLGQDGIVGVKTGTTSQAGGCFVVAAEHQVGGKNVTLLGVVLGQRKTPIVWAALNSAKALVKAGDKALMPVTIIKKGALVGHIVSSWHAPITVRAAKTVTVIGWPGLKPTLHVVEKPLKRAMKSGTVVATLDITYGSQKLSVPVTLSGALPAPSTAFRLTRL